MDIFKLLGTISIQNDEAIGAIDETTEHAEKLKKNLGDKFTAVGNKATEIGEKLKWVSVGAGAAFGAMVHYASDFDESMNKVKVAFDTSADDVIKWSKTTLQNFGIAQGTALDMAATFGDMSTSMGLLPKDAADMSTSLVGLAGDLASFKNIGIDQAMTALNGIFTGETESLKSLGVVMTQTNLDAFALANGFGKTTKEMDQAEQVQLRYKYVMEMTKNAHDDFRNTLDGTANQMRVFKEGIKEVAASIGSVLMPITSKFFMFVNKLMQGFMHLSDNAKLFVVAIVGMTAALSPVLVFGGKFVSLIGTIMNNWEMLMGGLKKGLTFLITNPIILVIAAVTAAVVLLYQKSETFRNAVNQLGSSIMTAVKPAIDALKNAFTALQPVLSGAGSMFTSLINIIGNVLGPVISALTPLVSKVLNMMANTFASRINMIIAVVNRFVEVGKAINKYLIQPVENASAKIKKSVDKIKSTFSSLKIKIPSFKVPSITVQWKSADSNLLKALGLKGLPSLKVNWNAEGAIFKQPAILNSRLGLQGVGEAGAEAIAPISKLQDYVADASAAANGELAEVMQDVKESVDRLASMLPAAIAEGFNNQKIDWNGRELGRFINTYAR